MVDYKWRINALEKIYGTQKELADSLGVSSRMLRYYKSGEYDVSQKVRDKINSRWSYYSDKKALYINGEVVFEEDGQRQKIYRRSSIFELDEDVKEQVRQEVEQEIVEQGGYMAQTDAIIEPQNIVEQNFELKVTDLS